VSGRYERGVRSAVGCTQPVLIRARPQRHQYLSLRPKQGQWFASVLGGHLAYYAVPDNTDAGRAFRDQAASTGIGRCGAAASEPA
jgi:hypothetical protein